MSAKAQVLFIGLDGIEPLLVKKWIASGDLPVLGSLAADGLWCKVTNPPGFGNGAFWADLSMGANAGRHGRYKVFQMRPGTYDTYTFDEDTDLSLDPFWVPVSQAGKRVAVFDMPSAPLTKGINGVQTTEWLSHVRANNVRSWPAEAVSEAIARYGEDPFRGRIDRHGGTPEDYKRILASCLDRVALKTLFSCDQLKAEDWDLFLTTFGDAHDIGHTSWHLHDPDHAKYDAHLAAEIGDPIKAVYIALDAAVGRIIEAADPDTKVFVLGGLGMGPGNTATHLLDNVLRRFESGPATTPQKQVPAFRKLYRRLIPASARERVRDLAANQGVLLGDRAKRKYFALPHNDDSGAIRINLVGREPQGRTKPGAEFDATCAELENELHQLVNVDTGAPVVERVVYVRDLCAGERMDDLPDLLVLWNRSDPIRAVASPRVGEVRRDYPGTRTGDHRQRAFLVGRGPGIAPGEIERIVPVTAVAPTLTTLLDVAMPSADSEPIPEFCAPAPGN